MTPAEIQNLELRTLHALRDNLDSRALPVGRRRTAFKRFTSLQLASTMVAMVAITRALQVSPALPIVYPMKVPALRATLVEGDLVAPLINSLSALLRLSYIAWSFVIIDFEMN